MRLWNIAFTPFVYVYVQRESSVIINYTNMKNSGTGNQLSDHSRKKTLYVHQDGNAGKLLPQYARGCNNVYEEVADAKVLLPFLKMDLDKPMYSELWSYAKSYWFSLELFHPFLHISFSYVCNTLLLLLDAAIVSLKAQQKF
ncbi:hypothetical protein GQX74_008750 [Glossina fuscipes]|nr:hypothetical protein GQX74_008750 [Glossina fuscipes]